MNKCPGCTYEYAEIVEYFFNYIKKNQTPGKNLQSYIDEIDLNPIEKQLLRENEPLLQTIFTENTTSDTFDSKDANLLDWIDPPIDHALIVKGLFKHIYFEYRSFNINMFGMYITSYTNDSSIRDVLTHNIDVLQAAHRILKTNRGVFDVSTYAKINGLEWKDFPIDYVSIVKEFFKYVNFENEEVDLSNVHKYISSYTKDRLIYKALTDNKKLVQSAYNALKQYDGIFDSSVQSMINKLPWPEQ
jgi:hypothetical protein